MTSPNDADLSYLAERVRVALATDARAGVLGLVVRSTSGRIFISGPVPTTACREAVALVAAEIAGTIAVMNETTVTSALEPGAEHEVLQ
jgi:hypothetical protein